MLRSRLISQLAAKFPRYSEAEIALAVKIIVENLTTALAQGDRVELRGFGTFCLHYHPPRKAHNPKTKNKVVTVAKYLPHFKPAKALKNEVDKF